ncbi:hypothetical protein Sango_0695200 [Sesamum angolense]|uniref:MULE transposase domain-containing protein n=1 Tax=Sesamum angolense TaxID=2727404 RepID=A0AAE2BZA2_9LAMI|nr:hypothetical protein Sango_0695200 [Sesamum angolense]
MCISYLNGLGEKLGYMGPKRFYRLDSNRNKFRVISYQTDVLALCDGYSSKNREFTLYLEANIDELATQIGSSNPIAVVGDEKGKGVAIEGGVSPRFDEEDWAEVFKLVDSYGESAGWNCDQGVMQVDLQSEGEGSGHSEGVGEGDSLHESEYRPEDEEDGENRDEEGVQKGEQESSESDNSSDSDFCVSEEDFDSEESFRTDPNRNVKGFRKDIIKDIRCHVSKHQAYRAKRKALNAIEGQLGVDGCHLKGPHGGILLTAVSIDPNNNLYPLAYAVVSGETRESWEWFLELLKGDLNVVRDDTYTFISDKQKGLIPAFESVFPATHLHMQKMGPNWDPIVETFLEVYKHAILPVNGPQLWTKTGKKKDSTISKQTERGSTFTAFKKDYKEHTTSSCYRTQPSNNRRGNTTFIA